MLTNAGHFAIADWAQLNDKLIFSYTNELWVSDGTDSGTQKIKAFYEIRNSMVALNGKVFFFC